MPFAAPPSARSTISGSSTATSASKSPFCTAARNASTTRRWVRRSASEGGLAADLSTRPARELARGDDRAIHDRRDLLERHAKHVVEHERQPFRRLELLEDDEQRESDRVGQHGVRFGIPVGPSDHGIGQVRVQGFLPARCPRPQHVQAHARDDRRQPTSQVLDVTYIGPAESNPAFLDRIVGLAGRPEHPIRHGTQMRAVLFELLGERLGWGHRSHSSVVVRHGSDGRNMNDVTGQEEKMKFVMMVYQGSTPLPGSDRWQALPEAEQRAIYADYAELNKIEGVGQGLPLGLPDASRTVQVRDGKTQVRNGTYLAEGAGGYFVYEAENMDAAIALAARIPAARLGGAVEIRPAEKYW